MIIFMGLLIRSIMHTGYLLDAHVQFWKRKCQYRSVNAVLILDDSDRNAWASKGLEAELNYKRLLGCFLNICAHPGNILPADIYYCKDLSTHWVPQSSFGNRAPQKGNCAAGRSLPGQSLWTKAFGIQQLPVRHSVRTGAEFISFSRKKIKLTANYFQHKCMLLPSGKEHIWTFLGPSSEYCLSVHIQHATFN